MGAYENGGSIPIITKGEGVYIFDDRGKKCAPPSSFPAISKHQFGYKLTLKQVH